jgi:hypothetical protein
VVFCGRGTLLLLSIATSQFIDATEICSRVDQSFAFLETVCFVAYAVNIFDIDCLQDVKWLRNCSK